MAAARVMPTATGNRVAVGRHRNDDAGEWSRRCAGGYESHRWDARSRRLLQLDGKQVALPTGSWIVAADGANDRSDPSIGAYGDLRTIILFLRL